MSLPEDQRFMLRRQHAMFHGRCAQLADLIGEQVHPVVDRAPKHNGTDHTVLGLHLRALGWGFSVRRLDDVFDNQAHSAACRALFEIVVDLVLLTKGVEPIEKLVEWERLVKVRQAERAVSAQGTEAFIRQTASTFVNANTATVAAAFAKHWPKHLKQRRDPMRWTGAGLAKDAEKADAVCPLGLGDFSREEYPRMCWGTHGSGLVLERGISEDAFPGLSILALNGISNMLGHVIRLVLEHFQCFDATWAERITNARNRGVLEANRRAFDAIARRAGSALDHEDDEGKGGK